MLHCVVTYDEQIFLNKCEVWNSFFILGKMAFVVCCHHVLSILAFAHAWLWDNWQDFMKMEAREDALFDIIQ